MLTPGLKPVFTASLYPVATLLETMLPKNTLHTFLLEVYSSLEVEGPQPYGYLQKTAVVYFGFFLGVILTLFFSTNFKDLISLRIAAGSGLAFLTAQLLDVQVFDKLRKKIWFIAPLVSSLIGSFVDTILFFFIAFYKTGVPWFNLAIGDFSVKIFIALLMLIPFRILLNKIKDQAKTNIKLVS